MMNELRSLVGDGETGSFSCMLTCSYRCVLKVSLLGMQNIHHVSVHYDNYLPISRSGHSAAANTYAVSIMVPIHSHMYLKQACCL